ncbi:paraquat-inducible protein A [Zobellella maritima]|uniref:paraquat-inducible protein A n=1 Tax=Zobellella maritima TaxID=2059725 RepID=UPI000E3075A8|nr:paraquat-inducible protein A [Zobellella maritima]
MNETPERSVMTCPSCDLVVMIETLNTRADGYCPRCAEHLFSGSQTSRRHHLALAITGLLLLWPSVAENLFQLYLAGQMIDVTMLKGILLLWRQDYWFVCGLVAWCGLLAPLGLFIGIILLSLDIWPRRMLVGLLVLVNHCREWSMVEVFVISLMVAIFKLIDVADLTLGPALVPLVALMLLITLVHRLYDPEIYWRRLDALPPPAEDSQNE